MGDEPSVLRSLRRASAIRAPASTTWALEPGLGLQGIEAQSQEARSHWEATPALTRVFCRAIPGSTRDRRAATPPTLVEASRARRGFPLGWRSCAGTVETRTERERALAGPATIEARRPKRLVAGLRMQRRRTIESRIGARLGLARESVGRGRLHQGHDPSPGSDSNAAVPSLAVRALSATRSSRHNVDGTTSTQLLATLAAILIRSSVAVPARPQCGYGCGDDRVVY